MIAYGIDAKSKDDPHIQTAERGLQAVAFGAHIRGQLFDFFPLCEYITLPPHTFTAECSSHLLPLVLRLPSWFPGATVRTIDVFPITAQFGVDVRYLMHFFALVQG